MGSTGVKLVKISSPNFGLMGNTLIDVWPRTFWYEKTPNLLFFLNLCRKKKFGTPFWSKTIIFWKFQSEKFFKCRIFDILASPWKFSLHYLESRAFEVSKNLKKFCSNSTSRVWASAQKSWRQENARKTVITHVTQIEQIFKCDIRNQRWKLHLPGN